MKHKQEHEVQSGLIGGQQETMTPTVIVPVKTDKEQNYRIRTMLDSGSSANWITKDVLQHIKFTSLGKCKVQVHHFGGIKSQTYQVVQIYIDTKDSLFKKKVDNKYKNQISVECFVYDEFTFHSMVPGIRNYIEKNYTLSEYVLNKIIEPNSLNISHADIDQGTALILSNASKIKIMGRKPAIIRLSRVGILLEQTIFGYAVSGKVPEELMSKTHDIKNNRIVSMLTQTINFSTCLPEDEYFLGCQTGLRPDYDNSDNMIRMCQEKDQSLSVIKSETHKDDDEEAIKVKESKLDKGIGQCSTTLPFNSEEILKSNEIQARVRSYKDNEKMVRDDKVLKNVLREGILVDNLNSALYDVDTWRNWYTKCKKVFMLGHFNFKFRRKKITALLGQVHMDRIWKSLWTRCFIRPLKLLYSLENIKKDIFKRNFHIEKLDALKNNNSNYNVNDNRYSDKDIQRFSPLMLWWRRLSEGV